jgi:predicted membrane protein
LWSRFQTQLSEGESSDRSFGLLVGGAFILLGVLPAVRHHNVRLWMVILGGILMVLGAVFPRSLREIKRAWLFFGFLLGLVVSPIVLGILFFAVITPFGWFMRRRGRDSLRLRSNPALTTYWRTRTEPPSAMDDQF